MSKRIKTSLRKLNTRAEADAVLGEFRAYALERSSRLLQIEQERKRIEDQHTARLAEIETSLDARAEQLRVWADEHPSEFGNRKSLDLTHGVIGWRLGQPTLKTLSGWTWDRVLSHLVGQNIAEFIRTKKEVAKDMILAFREDLGEAGLKSMGCRVVQDEPFFIEPKIEEPTVRATEV